MSIFAIFRRRGQEPLRREDAPYGDGGQATTSGQQTQSGERLPSLTLSGYGAASASTTAMPPPPGQEQQTFDKALAKCRQVLLVLCFISLFVNLLSLAVPFFLLQVIDAVIPTRSSETLILLMLFFTAALICYVVLDALRSSALGRLGTWLDRSLSGMMLRGAINRAARRTR